MNPEGRRTGGETAILFGFHALMLGGKARGKGAGDLKQIRVTRVMKGWRKTLEEGEASSLMGNIRGVGVSWWKTFRWMIPRVPWRDFRGNGRYGIEQKEAKELVPPIILFHARRPFCFVVIPWVNYSCFLPSSSRNWTRVAFLALSFLVILVIRVIIFRICVYCSTRYKFLLYFTFSIFESSESVFLLSLIDDTSSFFLELRIEWWLISRNTLEF